MDMSVRMYDYNIIKIKNGLKGFFSLWVNSSLMCYTFALIVQYTHTMLRVHRHMYFRKSRGYIASTTYL